MSSRPLSPRSRIARSGDGVSARDPLRNLVDLDVMAQPSDPQKAAEILTARLGLTPRQAEVLHWIAEGKSNGEIATILSCSFFTVKTHVKEIFHRLGVHSRASAVACVYRLHIGLLQQALASPEGGIPQKRVAV